MPREHDPHEPAGGPRLGLDRLLEQLVERAEEILETQNRLRRLLRATRSMVEELDLTTVLYRIIDAAVELVGARYGAVGVFDADGRLEQFIHVGMDDDAVERIGHLPEGRGLLGALVDEDGPVRLRSIADDPRSVGFPEGHPPMRSFLGVPIRVHGETYGNLYLTEQRAGEFSADDEELVTALAATAGVAIANARLFEESRLRERWTAASIQITHELLAREGPDALELIATRVLELASADLVTVVLPSGEDRLHVDRAVGSDAEAVLGAQLPTKGTLVGRTLLAGHAQLMDDISDGTVTTYFPRGRFGPTMAIPLLTSDGARGALSVTRYRHRQRFTDFDLEVAASFAAQATLALELSDAQQNKARVSLLEDRERIARDLHDHVVQRLFAAGLTLQGVSVALGPGDMAQRVQDQVEEIDSTIRQIRTSIFALRSDRQNEARPGLRAQVLRIAESQMSSHSGTPGVTFRGPVDTVVPRDMHADVLAVVREGLSNAGRHAKADRIDVTLSASAHQLTVEVSDDGVGMSREVTFSGLTNLRERAETHHGTCTIEAREPRGTKMVWAVPISGGDS